MNAEKEGLMARVAAELKKTLGVSLYLALFLGAFTTYRRLLLAEYQISYFRYGYVLFEALVLAKVVVLGSVLRVGERFRHRPLIVPTLYKTLCFSILLLGFTVLEHLIAGWFHGKATSAILNEILDRSRWEILAQVLVKVLALLPLFAVWEISRVLGEVKLGELFFTRGTRPQGANPSSTAAPPHDASTFTGAAAGRS
jgi:hypothetical protein